MALKGFSEEEWWPVYLLEEPGRGTRRYGDVEIPDDLLARYESVLAEFKAVQDELWEIVEPIIAVENDKKREAAAKRGNPHVGPTWQYPDG